ncbi:TraB/GumN family protein [Phenylobacterium sp.]|uniref:TraB/GumN family protein n=1 Tax=Phenylobacterium sp. TaxID=1871053 RepID=UPI0025F1A250|nr:TraB/GumN family protein [Phenylobacterium sp.]MCA3746948.1 TraB/GumN family protein [Phenylobacterium sp.]
MLARFRNRRPTVCRASRERPGALRPLVALGVAATVALTLGRPVPLAAQNLPPDPDADLIEELVVTARFPGPALWRVSRGEARVWVLGVPSLAPKRQQWDRQLFERYLSGAGQVILPFNGLRVRLAGSPGAAVSYLRLRSVRPFEAGLAPAERDRFAAARNAIGQPPGRYPTQSPLAAALILAGDWRERHDLTPTDPTKLIRLLARRTGKTVVQRTYDLGPLLGAVARTPEPAGRACLEAVLAEVEAGPEAIRAASRAWARGDVAGALAAERTWERCIAAAPGAAAFDALVKADLASDIRRALSTPGSDIAVVPLRPLLSEGGVLDRLRREGFTVETPEDIRAADEAGVADATDPVS